MLVALAIACGTGPAPLPAPVSDAIPREPRAVRTANDATEARLEVAVRTVERAGRRVSLVGAVHVADPAFYDELGATLAACPAVLAEGLEPDPDAPPPPDDDVAQALAAFGLAFQSDALSPGEGWRRVDLSVAEVRAALAGRGIDPAPWLDDRDRGALRGLGDATDPRRRALVRLALLGALGDDPPDDAAYWDVLVGLRDAAVVAEVLRTEGDACVLYGADHLPDLEARLVRAGFARREERWSAAIRVAHADAGLGPVQVRQRLHTTSEGVP